MRILMNMIFKLLKWSFRIIFQVVVMLLDLLRDMFSRLPF